MVDSVHTVADVNVEKEDSRRRNGQPPRDPDARWGTKGSRRERDERGKLVWRREHFYGYKAHVSLNARSGIITSVRVTPGHTYDGHRLPDLVREDQAQGVPVGLVVGDRGYDDGENHEFLKQHGLGDALHGTATGRRSATRIRCPGCGWSARRSTSAVCANGTGWSRSWGT